MHRAPHYSIVDAIRTLLCILFFSSFDRWLERHPGTGKRESLRHHHVERGCSGKSSAATSIFAVAIDLDTPGFGRFAGSLSRGRGIYSASSTILPFVSDRIATLSSPPSPKLSTLGGHGGLVPRYLETSVPKNLLAFSVYSHIGSCDADANGHIKIALRLAIKARSGRPGKSLGCRR